MTRHLGQQFVQLQIHRYNRYTDTDAKLKDKTGPKLCFRYAQIMSQNSSFNLLKSINY